MSGCQISFTTRSERPPSPSTTERWASIFTKNVLWLGLFLVLTLIRPEVWSWREALWGLPLLGR